MKYLSYLTVFLFSVLYLHCQPSTITYQGKLLDGSGNPVTNPAQAMSFSIFSAVTDGAALWGPVVKSVNVQDGMYTVYLGETSPLAASDFSGTEDRYLEVIVGSTTLPRTKLRVVPYAFKALSLTDEAWASPGEIGSTTPNTGIFTNLTANTSLTTGNADINGGTIDGTAIGATSPNTGAFTSLSANNGLTVSNGPVKMFGAWETKSDWTPYLALTDGIVIAEAYYAAGLVHLVVWEDGNGVVPYETEFEEYVYNVANSGIKVSITMPVRKGRYWGAQNAGTGTCNVYWIPLGN